MALIRVNGNAGAGASLPFGLKEGEGIFSTQLKSGKLPTSLSEKWYSFGNGFALCNVSNMTSAIGDTSGNYLKVSAVSFSESDGVYTATVGNTIGYARSDTPLDISSYDYIYIVAENSSASAGVYFA